MQPSINNKQLKDIIKTAVTEVLEERQDLLQGAIEAALEDLAFLQAIKEGEKTKTIKREEIFKVLEEKA